MSESATSARKVRGREREDQSLNFRKAGMTYEQIGTQLGITRQAAHSAVTRALTRIAQHTNESAEQMRTLELERLDRMLAAIWSMVLNGSTYHIDTALRIMARRAKLMGLDAPEQANFGGQVTLRVVYDGDDSNSTEAAS
jgi:hypothetical protein